MRIAQFSRFGFTIPGYTPPSVSTLAPVDYPVDEIAATAAGWVGVLAADGMSITYTAPHLTVISPTGVHTDYTPDTWQRAIATGTLPFGVKATGSWPFVQFSRRAVVPDAAAAAGPPPAPHAGWVWQYYNNYGADVWMDASGTEYVVPRSVHSIPTTESEAQAAGFHVMANGYGEDHVSWVDATGGITLVFPRTITPMPTAPVAPPTTESEALARGLVLLWDDGSSDTVIYGDASRMHTWPVKRNVTPSAMPTSVSDAVAKGWTAGGTQAGGGRLTQVFYSPGNVLPSVSFDVGADPNVQNDHPSSGWIVATGPAAFIRGNLDSVDVNSGHVVGWSNAVEVEMVIDGEVIDRAAPGGARPDVQAIYPTLPLGTGWWYLIPDKFYDGGAHTISIFGNTSAGGSGIALSGSPVTVTLPDVGAAGALQSEPPPPPPNTGAAKAAGLIQPVDPPEAVGTGWFFHAWDHVSGEVFFRAPQTTAASPGDLARYAIKADYSASGPFPQTKLWVEKGGGAGVIDNGTHDVPVGTGPVGGGAGPGAGGAGVPTGPGGVALPPGGGGGVPAGSKGGGVQPPAGGGGNVKVSPGKGGVSPVVKPKTTVPVPATSSPLPFIAGGAILLFLFLRKRG